VTVSGSDSTFPTSDSITLDSTNPDSTPEAIFQTERFGDTQWDFSVTAGQSYEVRLYFAEIFQESSGEREFNVSIEGQQVLDNYDIYADVGHDVGTMKSFSVTPSDSTLDIDFTTVTDNAKISAIEIVPTESQPDELGASPSSVDFGTVVTGNSETETVTLTNLGNASNSSHPDITISDVSITGTDSGQFSQDFSGSVTLAPEESTTVDVTYSPSEAQNHAATMEVTHSGNNSPLTVGLSGEGVSSVPVGFGSSGLQGFNQGSLTALEFGPDDRLYVAQQDGDVYALEIERSGENSYSVVSQEQITSIKSIPNHDDNGNYVSGENSRQVTGLTVGGTASQPVVYVSSSDPTIDVGTDDDDTDTNSGSISRLTLDWNSDGSLTNVDHTVMVLGLPRSEENHATNGLDLSDDGSTLYVAQGGHANKGAPSNNFGHTPEYALSAAVLEIDLAQINNNYQTKNLQNYNSNYPSVDFLYALPTIQNDDRTGDDLPFGGNDGVNQAKWVESGPVQVYSSGYRNPYDLVLSEDDQLYVIDNGPNGGWGGQPVNEGAAGQCTNEPNEDGSYGTGDQLHLATEGSYGGHAAPIRANPTGADIYDADGNMVFDINESNSPIPSSLVNAVECDYQDPTEDNSIGSTFGWTAGIDEYTASNFGGEMQGDLLVVESGSSVERVELNSAGDGVTNQESNFFTPGSALGIEAVGDDGPFPGTVWTARGDITVFEPNDYGDDSGGGDQCTGADDPSLDEDGDGYDNADEIDAGTDPCSAASTPADFDDDGTSNLNDPDDDDDGIDDTEDLFAVDADDGTTTSLPIDMQFTETDLFGENGQGWTGLMMNGSDYQDLYDSGQMTVGGAAQVLTVEDVPQGDAVNNQNDQQFAFQRGFVADQPFTVETTVNGLPSDAESYQSQGIFLGTGDQDNYVKLTATGFSTGGGSGVQLATESNGNFNGVANPSAPTAGNETTLSMTVYPNNGTVEAYYAVGGGETQFLDQTTVPTSWFDASDGNGTAVGVISTSNGASSTFDSTWQYLTVEPLETGGNSAPTADAGSDQTVDENTTVQLDASGSGDSDGDTLSYEWTQTGGPSVTLSDATAAQPTFTAPEVDGDQTLTFEVNVSDGNASDIDSVNVTVQDTDTTTGEVVYTVNAGGSAYTAGDGTEYAADPTGALVGSSQTYSTSSWAGTPPEIDNTDDDPLYRTERYGTDFGYNVSVAESGTYKVTLRFAEIYQGTPPDSDPDADQTGQRVFDVTTEGQTVLDDYDVYAEAGDSLTAVDETYAVEVTNGTLNIGFDATGPDAADNAKISAIEVTKVDAGNTAPTIEPIQNQTVTEGESTEVDVNTSDADGDSVSLSLSGAPSFASLSDDGGDGNGTLSLAPGTGDAGSYQFDVVADDGQTAAAETVNVTVEEPADTGTYGVETGEATNVQINTSTLTNASATVNGTLTLGDKSEATTYVKFWVEGQPENSTFWYTADEPMTSSGEFQFDVVLSPSTTYKWQTLSQSGDGEWTAGEVKRFTTPTGEYFGVTTNDATGVGVESATLNGEIINLGDNDNATVYFTYWKQGQKDSTLTWYTGPVEESTGPFSAEVGVDPDTTYEFRAFGQSDEGEWKAGPVNTFTTQQGQPYGVATEPATNVSAESATLNGDLTGLGDYDNATVYFTYWVEGQKDSTLTWYTGPVEESTGPFSANVSGLNSGTNYVVQAYAQNDEGEWTAGSEETFATDAAGANQPPTAAVSVNDSSPTVGETVQFDASESDDGDGTVASYDWDFDGDGTVDQTTNEPTVTHAYASAGDYTATVTVTDDDGATGTATQAVSVAESAAPNASATIQVTPDSSLEASTYNSGSFEVTNTGEQNVTSVTIDLSSTSMPDMVFDPDGTAGDQAGKGLSIDSQSGDGVGVVSTADGDVFSQPHNGVNGSDGYDVLTIEFTDFEPGESVAFSADNDPTSIKNATVGSQEAGPVSGLELARATVTVGYESTTQTTQTVGDGSQGGTESVADASVPAAPSIDVEGVSLDATALDARHSAATVTDASQTVNVSAPAGSTVTLVRVEGELELDNVPTYDGTPGYEIEDYEANKAENVEYYSATVDASGTVSIPVTLTNSTDVGGYNYFVAHVEDAEGAGLGSNVVVLKLESGGTTEPAEQPVYAVNAGGSAYTAVDGTEYAADAYFYQSAGTSPTSEPTGNTEDDTLYQTERYGDPLSYGFPVSDGNYNVTLQFAEIYHGVDGGNPGGGVGDRLFNVSIEGQQVLTNYDIYEEVGPLSATDKTFTVGVSDGTLNVTMDASVDYAKVSAITVDNATTTGGGNTAPSIDAISDQTVVTGENETVSVSASDADGDALTLSKTAGPAFVTLTDNGDGTGTLDIAPQSGDAGTYTVEVTADDGTDQTTESFQLTVETATDVTAGTATHRVNAGGGTIAAVDSGPDWTGVTGTSSQYLVTASASGGNYCGGDAVTPTSAVPSSTPDAVYDCERFDAMQWAFDADQSATYEVRLYLGNQFPGTNTVGDRQYNVSIEGQQVLTQYDPVLDVGHANGTVKAFNATDSNGDGQITVTFEVGAVENPQVNAIEVVNTSSTGETTTESASFTVTENGGIDASTYGGGSFEITNTGDTQITSVTYDLGSSTFPDVVFDPEGTAGDSGAKGFTPDSGGSATGLQGGSFAAPHNGADSSDGYDELTATFDDFGGGETFAFSVDIDPTSIKNASGTGAAGAVSGLEMSSATVTVEYADGTTQTTQLFGDGSAGGSQATAKEDVATAPTLGVDGVSLDAGALDSQHSAATVSSASQTITVSGPAGATVELLHVEGQLELANQADGYELEQYEANTAENVDYQTVDLGSDGQATVDVTLLNTSSSGVEGGFNHFVATVSDADGDSGQTSNVVVLKYEESS
jgi:hypothetical protein